LPRGARWAPLVALALSLALVTGALAGAPGHSAQE